MNNNTNQNNVNQDTNLNVTPPIGSVPNNNDVNTNVGVNATSHTGTNVDVNTTNESYVPFQNINEKKEELTIDELQRRRDLERAKRNQEAQANYKPPSKFKSFILILFFVILIGYVWFLPDINKYLELIKGGKEEEEIITTGVLECKFTRSTENLDIEYESDFSFEDSKLNKLSYIIVTRGDADLDADTLEKTNNECVKVKDASKDLDGVEVSCSFNHDRVTSREIFYYNEMDAATVSSAFVEAGGTYPEFKNGQNIDKIEDIMKNSGYDCKRVG